MQHIFSDGGRATAGYSGNTRDCVVRAVAIASKKPYQEVYDAINEIAKQERPGSKRRRGKRSNARTGVFKPTSKKYIESIGGEWFPTMQIGSGCKVHLKNGELPMGRLVVSLSRHFAAVIDGVLFDTHDCSRDGTRCVYGFWRFDNV
jgi:hypothetical protein